MTVGRRGVAWIVAATCVVVTLVAALALTNDDDAGSINATGGESTDGASLTKAESSANTSPLSSRAVADELLASAALTGGRDSVDDETDQTDADNDPDAADQDESDSDDETDGDPTGPGNADAKADPTGSTTDPTTAQTGTNSSTTGRPGATSTSARPTTTTTAPPPTAPPTGGGDTYHVDCSSGNDANTGLSAQQAIRTLTRANQLPLRPGDQLLLKRSCSWSGGQRIDAGWNGTSSKPITIGAYGSGDRPRIVDGKNQGVKVTGSHLVVENLHITFGVSETRTTNGCTQPFGDYYGVNFTNGAHHVRLTGSILEKANAGVHIGAASSSITVQGNVLRNNNVMNVWGGDPAKDLGAWGLLLRSNDNDVSYNEFSNNRATCANGAGRIHSNSVEIFEGSRNYIHHNQANDRVFSELGGSASEKAADNRFEYNLHRSTMVDARFITTRGGGSVWGPVYRTTVEHNTVHLTGGGSVAVSCGEGCGSNILRLRGNILIGADKPLFADANFDEADNVYWHPGGQTRIQIASSNKLYSAGTAVLNGSIVADPLLTSSQRPSSGSPAINRSDSSQPRSGTDLAGTGVQGGTRDAGAYEVG